MNNITKRSTFAAIIAASALTLSACSQAALPDTIKVQNTENQVITVQSTETVKVVPDMAEITLAVYTQAADAKSCQDQNQKDLENALKVLESAGIEKTSIQTSNYGLEPVYDWNTGKDITGYEMNTNITISDIPIDTAGELITSCVDAGINRIQSVDYLSSQYDASYQEALKKAMDSAKSKAQAIAEAGGATLGGVVHVEEYSSSQQARYNGYQRSAATGAAKEMAAAIAVEPGQIGVEARISVNYEIVK
ncbi:DUF541 domain-containing protein [Clostridium sp. MCC353]|uniref:SIMPL domain-containing protein n=1 Tax=Clostridium sp. MCC353 TaxID=2592646 RepID=UPI001C0147EE|nr:SIMPL domain-containing protein [Clostridium sp. MCC353]MBT9777110.1 DUF541 domain-containing protein [Clostridium sp. MCC353]